MSDDGGQLYHGLNFAAYGGKVNRFDDGGRTSLWSDITNTVRKIRDARTDPKMSAEVMNNIEMTFDNEVVPNLENGDNPMDAYGTLIGVTPYYIATNRWGKVAADRNNEFYGMPQYLNDGTAQRTFLLNRDLQEQEFRKDGWINKPSDGIEYGLVAKQVGSTDAPVYQLNPDEEWRLNLHPIGNTMAIGGPGLDESEGWFPHRFRLPDPGSYPTSLYISDNGNFYQKGWDYNDYSGVGGFPILGAMLDAIGSPTVTTTGFTRFEDDTFWNDVYPYISKTRDYREADPGKVTVIPNFEQVMHDYYNMLPEISVTHNKSVGSTNAEYDPRIKLRLLGGDIAKLK